MLCFIMLIHIKKSTSGCLHFNIYEYDTLYAQLSRVRIKRYIFGARPRGYKTFIKLKSTEHEISTAPKTKIPTN